MIRNNVAVRMNLRNYILDFCDEMFKRNWLFLPKNL